MYYWYKYGRFENDEQAQGAFELAYQQGCDGMGKSVHEWMGLTEEQLDEWVKNGTLPPKKKEISVNN